MNSPAPPASPASQGLADALSIARYHIVLIAMTGMLTFGWLMSGRYLLGLSVIVGLDWFLINLMNRITDIAEDLKNGIPGTARVAHRQRLLTWGSGLLLFGSLLGTHLLWPQLTPWRILVQVVGLCYNYRLLPTPRGLSRFKELYFFKNFASAALFILTCFVYPFIVTRPVRGLSAAAVLTLALFFLIFEHTYEILYDFRDLAGDRAEGIPTYPVVHGPAAARRLVAGLLWLAAAVLLGGLLTGVLGLREGLMLAAPLIQWLFYRRRLAVGLTSADCIRITHLGTGLLVLFLVGTAVWQHFGLPQNIYFF
ncbi:MAG TPA: UbiA family prenyltransferase [Pseudomonadota bacterium]|nr:UbiA family prenyltransferase [Pseudomonadota bacterium]